MQLILMPGMDGTGELFAPLLQHLPHWIQPTVVSYPTDRPLGYDELLQEISFPTKPYALLAESFSGPLAINHAAKEDPQLKALILVVSFACAPSVGAKVLGRFSHPCLFSLPTLPWLLRFLLLNRSSSNFTLDSVTKVLDKVSPSVMARRLREIATIDVRSSLSGLTLPMLSISARFDRLVPPKMAKEIQKLQPKALHHPLDASHLVLQTQPRSSAKIIGDFLSDFF